MGSRTLQCFSIFLLCLFLSPGPSVAEKHKFEATQKNRKLETKEKRMLSSPSMFTTQLDAVPVVNPTTPGTTSPGVNPDTSPPAPTIITGPNVTPPAPTTTAPAGGAGGVGGAGGAAGGGGVWCVANPTASETALQVALDYACGFGGADCAPVQPGAACYNPNTVRDHASYAFNDYYHKNPAPTSCVFGGTAQLTSTDPSNGNCHYVSTTGSTSTTPANPPPSPVMPSPTTTTPTTTTPTTTTPMTPDIYGAAEPTGLPSSATSVSCCLLLLFLTTGFVGSLVADNYL